MRILVIGGDAAGMSAASQIRRLQPSWQVEAFEMGDYTSYGLCGLPYYIGGIIGDINQLVSITPESFEKDRGIKVHTRHLVTAINPAKKTIVVKNLRTAESREELYDKLLIATGAEPIVPKGLEADLPGVYYLRGLDEAKAIRQKVLQSKSAVVVGAGYIGLELTEALVAAGLKVTLLGRRPAPIFEPEFQQLAFSELAAAGVDFRSGTDALGVKQTADGKVMVETSQGDPVIADLVTIGVGVRPRSELAAAAGLSLGARDSIAVDKYQQTSDPFIYAAGDCAESYHLLTKKGSYIPLALGANKQGKAAGLNICSQPEEFSGILGTSVFKLFDLALARTGFGLEEARNSGFPDAVKTLVKQASKPHYYPGSSPVNVAVIFDSKTGRLLGGQLAGSLEGVGQRINTFAAAITAGMTVREAASIDTAYAPPFSPVRDPVVIACEIAGKK